VEECAPRRILRNVVCVTVSFQGDGFSTLDQSFSSYQSLHMKCVLEQDMDAFKICGISYIHTDSSRSIFWIQKIFHLMTRWLFYVGMLVLTQEASAICLHLNLFFPEADLMNPEVPVCHRRTPVIGFLANCAI
jgi:hypothetical protein